MAGRTSAEAKLLEGAASGERPEPPKGLNAWEVELWGQLVDEKPADWFKRDNIELLKQYCRCSYMLKWLGEKITSTMDVIDATEGMCEDGAGDLEVLAAGIANLAKFQAMEDKYMKNLMAVATKLRLTPQAQILAPTAGSQNSKVPPGRKTWDAGEESPEDLMKPLEDDGLGEADLGGLLN